MYDNFFKSLIAAAICLLSTLGLHEKVAAQNQADSLENILETLSGIPRFDALYELCKLNFEKDNLRAFQFASEAYKQAIALGDSLLIVKSGRAKGNTLMKLDDIDGAIESFRNALDISRRNSMNDQVKFTLNGLALAYTYQANYDKALDCHFQSLVIREAEGNKKEISISYNNIGLVYYKLKDYEQAIKYFKEALSIKREEHDLYELDKCLINIGLCYNNLKSFNEAFDYLNEAFTICEDRCSDEIIVEGNFALGVAYQGVEDFEKARNYYQISFERATKTNNKRFQVENLMELHTICISEGKFTQALSYLNDAEKLLHDVDYNELKISLYNAFANFYNEQGDFENASLYQTRYIELKDSVYSDQLIRNLAKVQTNYEERQNIAIIAAKEEALIRQKRFNISVAIIALLAGLLVFVLYRSNLVKKRVNHALSEAKATIEEQNKQLTSLNRNLEKMVDARTVELQGANEALKRVNDELDNFIYKTSHDIRGPLASLKGMCNVAIMDVKDPLSLDYFNKLDATAEKLNTILTRLLIINQINNSSASHELIDFESIVEDVIVLERKRGLPPKLVIRKEIDEGIVFYSDKELIRIILENLIDNAIKFYNDSDRVDPFVEIRVVKEGSYLKIRVVDNGIGISQVNPDKIFQMFSRASERSGTGGIGLYLTKTATEKIGGQIDLRTTPEGYTEFFVRFSTNMIKMRTDVSLK